MRVNTDTLGVVTVSSHAKDRGKERFRARGKKLEKLVKRVIDKGVIRYNASYHDVKVAFITKGEYYMVATLSDKGYYVIATMHNTKVWNNVSEYYYSN